jgi:hypothetical protein
MFANARNFTVIKAAYNGNDKNASIVLGCCLKAYARTRNLEPSMTTVMAAFSPNTKQFSIS